MLMLRVFFLIVLASCSSTVSLPENSFHEGRKKEKKPIFNSIKEILDDCVEKIVEASLKVSEKETTELEPLKLFFADKAKFIKEKIKKGEKYPYYNWPLEIKGLQIDTYFILFFFEDFDLIKLVLNNMDQEEINKFYFSSISCLDKSTYLYVNNYSIYTLKLCLKKGVSIEPLKILLKIIQYDNQSLMKIMVKKYKIDRDLIYQDEEEDFYSLLQLSIKYHLNNISKFLINEGANLYPKETTYSTIEIAAITGNLDILEILIDKSSNHNIRSEDEENEALSKDNYFSCLKDKVLLDIIKLNREKYLKALLKVDNEHFKKMVENYNKIIGLIEKIMANI